MPPDDNQQDPKDQTAQLTDNELEDISEDDAKRLLEPAQDDQEGESGLDGSEHLGDAGKRALDKMKEQRREARDTARKAREEADSLRAKLKEYEDANKTEAQRQAEERDTFKTRAEKAERALHRREIAEQLAPEHATARQIASVAKRLTGDTDDELKADAEELFGFIVPTPPPTTKAGALPTKPRERLRGGGEPDTETDDLDPAKLAAQIPRAR